MKAGRVIELIQSLEPVEIEKLFVMLKDYETEVRRRQAAARYIKNGEEFEATVDKVFSENEGLFRKLAEYEKKERETSVT